MYYPSILLSINVHVRIVRFLPTVGLFSFSVKKLYYLITCLLDLFTEDDFSIIFFYSGMSKAT